MVLCGPFSQVYDEFVANCENGSNYLTRMESNPRVAMFIKACELQERCGGLRLRDFVAMPLQVHDYLPFVDMLLCSQRIPRCEGDAWASATVPL